MEYSNANSVKKEPSIGMTLYGEFRCVVTDSLGDIQQDTGYQKNLILDQGLDFFGGGKGSSFNGYCAVGSGNSAPTTDQTSLDAFIAITSGATSTNSYAYTDNGDNLYRVWEQKQYRFTGLNNVNISEVGLASQGSSSVNTYLTTRALIKDGLGAPTSISIKTGETLDIYYKVHKVINIQDVPYVISILDGNGGTVPYNVTARPVNIGGGTQASLAFSAVGISTTGEYSGSVVASGELTSNKSVYPSGVLSKTYQSVVTSPYIKGSYKRGFSLELGLNEGNGNIRTFAVTASSGAYQLRYGSVEDDSPIVKTPKDIASFPFEVSWGRFEGEL